jgi:predicted Zn-dependent protease with MMP-like domain
VAGDAVPLARLDTGTPAGAGGQPARPPRIVVYRRPLMARADGEEELGELVFDVVVEEFARILGIDPADVDPGYAGGE